MEEKIKRVVSRTKMMFVYFWLLPVFLVTFGETGGEWVGAYAGDVRVWGIERSGFFNGREKWAKDFENQRV